MQKFIAFSLALLLFANAVCSLVSCLPECHCDDKTLVVYCDEGNLDVLPITLNPFIQRLIIQKNKIKTIDSSIQFYSELTHLDLSSNHLMAIPQRTFAYQRNLLELNLSNNKVGEISNKTFIGLSSVTILNLRGNLITELQESTFTPLKNIEELNIGENRIEVIHPKAFDQLLNLRILYIDDNGLKSPLDAVIYYPLTNLAELYLGMNLLKTLPAHSFQDLKRLTRLNLRSSGLYNISENSFEGLEMLRTLDLSDNHMVEVPSASFQHLPRLEELFIGENNFEIIQKDAFGSLQQLKHLEINGALELKRILNGAFNGNTNLEYINLSSNRNLNELQPEILSGLPHLRHVLIRNNALNTFDEQGMNLQNILTFDLSENPLVCDCRLMWMHKLLREKNGSESTIADVQCKFPKSLQGKFLKDVDTISIGCTTADPRRQTLIGALIVGVVATLTTLALFTYRYRKNLKQQLKSVLCKEETEDNKKREYQKTVCDDDFATRHRNLSRNMGIVSSFPNTYTPPHSSTNYFDVCPNHSNEANPNKQNFQQLQIPSTGDYSHEKVSNMSPVAEPYYSYIDVPTMYSNGANSNNNEMQFVHPTFEQHHIGHFGLTRNESNEPSYIYTNANYSQAVEQPLPQVPFRTSPLPPELPLRNGADAAHSTD
ncbi:TLR4 interactor with leucine rich repeats-like [Teleopsis dalmanni]|uniref:TLR4 interactor with leucine rich repeats-like n=1 Tax=Teleopsis dalmanni TaxID=139649 RepID=UPI0018CD7936|nr:TLR4 interactor with leucine rich repeats-like [Teleopsis dalmanni]